MTETVRAYKRLAAVERAFRSLKTVDLNVCSIHHRLPDRVRAHVFLRLLAYYVEWHMRQALAPLLFDDDDKAAAELLRPSIVAPAQRSPRAKAKAGHQADGGRLAGAQLSDAPGGSGDADPESGAAPGPLGGVTLDVLATAHAPAAARLRAAWRLRSSVVSTALPALLLWPR